MTAAPRRAMMLLASAGGNRVPVIAKLVQADEDTVRDVIHRSPAHVQALAQRQRPPPRPPGRREQGTRLHPRR
ncbi:helix-turn-helix domain-containing protein [Streptomyces sp. HP-A2021]|nr:helix-turn-helix domain-containing protein [Streptomyces sp. HP-A2021]UOB15355.1 helix-turn-helix domain-containing protein [Streptomyces sp. HP-A2021]